MLESSLTTLMYQNISLKVETRTRQWKSRECLKSKKEKFAIVVIDELELLVEENSKEQRILQQELDGVVQREQFLFWQQQIISVKLVTHY